MSLSPEKLGKSSKSRTKSPCSPHADGDVEADALVLLVEKVVLDDVESAGAELELADGVVVDFGLGP